MKSDRRTLIIVAVLVCFLLFASSFQSLFLFGARLVASEVTVQGTSIVSSLDPNSSANLRAWSLKGTPNKSGSSRDERLGLVLVQMLNEWHRLTKASNKLPSQRLEEYCQENPEDLKARAHLTRLALNLNSLEDVKSKKELKEQSIRLAAMSGDCAKKDPDNWYWRDRQFHFLMLAGDQVAARKIFVARPFPTKFEDYVQDEVTCKEAVFKSQFFNLPETAILPLWSETLYPHFNSFPQFQEIVKSDQDSVDFRVAQIVYGQSMVKSCPTVIAALVGLRNIRHGLWVRSPITSKRRSVAEDLAEENKVRAAFQSTASKGEWDTCLRLANEEYSPSILHPDEDLGSLYVGQFGPIIIAAGILSCFYSVAFLILNRFKLKSFASPKLVWPILLIFLSFIGPSWKDWGYYHLFSLGSIYVTWAMITLALYCAFCSIKSEKGTRIILVATVVVALMMGFAYYSWQSTSTIFLILFAMQRGKTPLNPWTVAIGTFLLAYHTAFNLATSNAVIESHLWMLLGIATLYGCSRRPLEPDEPRFAPLTIGIPAIIFGIFLFAQYEKGVTATMQNEVKNTDNARARLSKV